MASEEADPNFIAEDTHIVVPAILEPPQSPPATSSVNQTPLHIPESQDGFFPYQEEKSLQQVRVFFSLASSIWREV
jgi:hypothetical protein